jgi:putative transposase
MFRLLFSIIHLFISPGYRRELVLEKLAFRQQLAVWRRQGPRPQLRPADRRFGVVLSQVWPKWRKSLLLVRPETVIGWHRRGFRVFWTWVSLPKRSGRQGTRSNLKDLVRKMAGANPLWGAPRIHGELLKPGFEISERTISRLMPRRRKPPSQTWKTFLENHLSELVSIAFFSVPTATFRVLFVLVVLAHHRGPVIHLNVTEHPTALWTGQQMVEAFPEDAAPRYLLRDRDEIYGSVFRRRIQSLKIEEVLSAPASPWQRAYVERVIGSVRRDGLDHVIILGERHLRVILKNYLDYYHRSQTHLGLSKDTPEPRAVQPPDAGRVVELPEVGGLYHRYERPAA